MQNKPHACKVDGCISSFARNYQLTAHKVIHTGVKPFKCTVKGCTASFAGNYTVGYACKGEISSIEATDIMASLVTSLSDSATMKSLAMQLKMRLTSYDDIFLIKSF